ncbi:Cof-type HAD-IIB family hydrolase [Aerococcus kribbianus]|uniref:Cof-type HAD-IIB family hydrolase n=1 Tax=Aerococcus kribbianus TaxID=2999064 RepID=A0A9X3FN82_9LACT|nr:MULTISPECIES: Cof-type HAD-IIB family hydrolase [unclassified Aerococcus]MCZ0717600.1 Cof-type HAD-IIB family hydrolase [Aerococcus sp. YH-aer221]MCZ0725888.1 Cof-type HAD-IIB family hydrolase [Aerococcus sp. YH-aer222]
MTEKLIFIDIDGTLVDYENNLPSSAVDAIHQAQDNGHLVIPVTGRSKAEMYENILAIGFDGYIGGNGNYVELNDQEIFHKHLTAEDTKAIVDWLHQRGLEYYLESNSGLYGSKKFAERGKETIQAYSAYKGKADAKQMDVKKVFPDMIFGSDPYRDDINKISFILDDYQDYLDAKKEFSNYKVGTWGGVGEKALFGDVALDNIDKSVGIGFLLQYLGKSKEDAFAFGDAKVDIPMIEYCGTGIAMGNAGPETKEAADYITADVDQDGMWKAFQHFGLI